MTRVHVSCSKPLRARARRKCGCVNLYEPSPQWQYARHVHMHVGSYWGMHQARHDSYQCCQPWESSPCGVTGSLDGMGGVGGGRRAKVSGGGPGIPVYAFKLQCTGNGTHASPHELHSCTGCRSCTGETRHPRNSTYPNHPLKVSPSRRKYSTSTTPPSCTPPMPPPSPPMPPIAATAVTAATALPSPAAIAGESQSQGKATCPVVQPQPTLHPSTLRAEV